MDKKVLIKKIIHEVCKQKGFEVNKIILFGSRARGSLIMNKKSAKEWIKKLNMILK